MPAHTSNGKNIEEIIARVAAADVLTPGIKLIYDLRTGEALYMSPHGLEELGISLSDLQEVGNEKNRRFFNYEQTSEYMPHLFDLLREGPANTFTFFQQARSLGGEWKWYLSSIHVLLKDEEGVPMLSLTVAHHVDPVSHLTPKVARMLEEQAFIREHQHLFDTLGEREKKVLELLARGATNIEMAAELNISVATVETHRKNIRRKLQVTTNAELGKYAMAFDLI